MAKIYNFEAAREAKQAAQEDFTVSNPYAGNIPAYDEEIRTRFHKMRIERMLRNMEEYFDDTNTTD